jgi:aspartate carbamoyltransferase catalytic subunit
LRAAKPDALIMHPGPMNRGVEIGSEIADDIDRSLIRAQAEVTSRSPIKSVVGAGADV